MRASCRSCAQLLTGARRVCIWDRERKARTLQKPAQAQPVTAACFSSNGAVLAYASGYDWGRGYQGLAGAQHAIHLHKARLHQLFDACP